MKIRISEISEGMNHFHFDVDASELDIDFIKFETPVTVDIDAYRVSDQIDFKLNFKCKMFFECDRCLEPFDYLCVNNFNVVYKNIAVQRNVIEDSQDDILKFYNLNDVYIDLLPDLRDLIIISVPMRKVHDENSQNCLALNTELNSSENSKKEVNPVWDKLVELKKKKKNKS
jgi:uncharacterized protein